MGRSADSSVLPWYHEIEITSSHYVTPALSDTQILSWIYANTKKLHSSHGKIIIGESVG